MEAINAYYDGHYFVPTSPVRAKRNQQAIVTVLTGTQENTLKSRLLSLAGSMRGEDYDDFVEALADAEKVDADEW